MFLRTNTDEGRVTGKFGLSLTETPTVVVENGGRGVAEWQQGLRETIVRFRQ